MKKKNSGIKDSWKAVNVRKVVGPITSLTNIKGLIQHESILLM